jgi:spermidine synthase
MRWFSAFFLASGFSALVYQIVWLRLAMAEFGVTTPLVSIVLAMFMAGLGFGCWAAGRLARYFEGSSAAGFLRSYALAELLIGASAVAVPAQLAWGHEILLGLGGERSISAGMHYGFSGLWIAFTLLPWCTCMGATVPLAMAAIQRGFGGPREAFSHLYLANVLGAVAGTLIPAFFLIEILGFRGTLWFAASVNALLASTALALSFRLRPSWADPAPASTEGDIAQRVVAVPGNPLWLLFATGLISLALEVVWVRQFTPYLGTVVYAFATILAAYLVATYLGSRAYRAWMRSARGDVSGLLWVSLAALALLPIVTADPRLPFPEGVHVWSFFRIGLGVGGFSAALGFLTPMLVDRWSGGDPRRAGHAYAINVLGSIGGPLLAGFGLLPLLSERMTTFLLAVPLLGIGLLAVGRTALFPRATKGRRVALAASPLAVALVLVALSEDFEGQFEGSLVRRDATATVIATGEGMNKRLLINGHGMTELTPTTKMMAHLPLAFMARAPQDGLVVAFGMGTSFRSLHSWGIRATAVELVPSVVDLFPFYHIDGPSLLASPRARIVIDDGRRLLERSVDQYDVVIVDPPPPVSSAGTSLLYSTEFYAIVKRRLRPGGILQQWLYLGGADDEVLTSVARALTESFPHVRVFRSFDEPGIHFLASMSPIPQESAATLAARLPASAGQDLVEWGPFHEPEAQFGAILSNEIPMAEMLGAAPSVRTLQDDWPVNEYYWFRHRIKNLQG